jgi:hypothetical protein
MTMDENIRVKTDKKHKTLYNQLKNLAVGDSHELFFVCACLAHKCGKRRPLGKKGEDRFWSRTITPEEWSCYYAMHLTDHKMNFQSLHDDAAVIAAIEEYANAGMEILQEELLRDFTTTSSGGEVSLDAAQCSELPKVFLHYIFEQGMT